MAVPSFAELHCHSHFSFLDGASAPDDLVARAVELGLTGLAITDHQGLYGAVRFSTAAEAAADAGAVLGTGSCALVRSDLCRGPLAVRNRHPGDRFRPVGLDGHKKLQDLFVDRKVDRARRARIPIVVDENDRIIWVAGYGIDEAFRVTDPAQAVLLLTVKVVGGPA